MSMASVNPLRLVLLVELGARGRLVVSLVRLLHAGCCYSDRRRSKIQGIMSSATLTKWRSQIYTRVGIRHRLPFSNLTLLLLRFALALDTMRSPPFT